MIKLLFVCHGNICRSPMAEFIMKDMVKRIGVECDFAIASCATSTEEIWGDIGNPVYPPAKAELAKHKISCEGKRAVQLKKSDYGKYDLLIGMDSMNLRNMMRIIHSDPQNKVSLLLDFTDSPHSVADPWYSGDFDATYEDVSRGCKALLQHILQSGL